MGLGIPNRVTGGPSAGSALTSSNSSGNSFIITEDSFWGGNPNSRAQQINMGTRSSSSNPSSPSSYSDYSFSEYLEGLLSSVGAEQETNRLYNAEQARLNREFQSAEAAIQRDWYESMANSSYQRSVNDLMKAGLNPVLAVSNGGASASVSGVPQGSNASVSGAQGDTLSSILNALASVASSVADFLPNISKIIKLK